MEDNHVKYTQVTPSEFPSKSQRQPPPSKPDAVTTALISIFETRVIDILPALGFLFLTYNVVEALLKAKGNYGTISFVVRSYANLIALFYCLKSFEKLTEGESPKKRRLKIAIWTLATSLNLSFSYRVTSILDSVVMSTFVWTLALTTTVGAFWGLFLVSEEETRTKKRRLKIAVPRKRNRPQGSGGIPHPSTPPVAAYDESEQLFSYSAIWFICIIYVARDSRICAPINNIGGIVPLTDEPTLPGPSSENDYWKIFNFKYSSPCVVMPLFIVIVQMILRTTHKTVGDYPINLVGTKIQIHLLDAVDLLLPLIYALVSPKLRVWRLQSVDSTPRASVGDEKQKFDKYLGKNTPRTDLFFDNTYEILQVFQSFTVTDNFHKADPINVPNKESTLRLLRDNELKPQSGLSNINSPAEPLDNYSSNSTTCDESNQTSIDIPGLSEQQVSTTNSESTYDDKQKFYKTIAKHVPMISIFFAGGTLLFKQAGQNLNLAEKILVCIAGLISFVGLFLFVHHLIKRPSPRTAKQQCVCVTFGLSLIVFYVGMAAVLMVTPNSPLLGAVIVILIIVLFVGYLLFTRRQTEDNRQD